MRSAAAPFRSGWTWSPAKNQLNIFFNEGGRCGCRILKGWPDLRSLEFCVGRAGLRAWRVKGISLANRPPTLFERPDPWGSSRSPERTTVGRLRRWDAYLSWRATIPAAIAERVKLFPDNHVLLLRLAARVPQAQQLLAEVPALFYMLAMPWEHGVTVQRPYRALRAWFSGEPPARELLRRLPGWKGSEAEVRLLRRVPPRAFSPQACRDLRDIAANGAALETLSRLDPPRVNAGVIALARDYLPRITPLLLGEAAGSAMEEAQPRAAPMIGHVLRRYGARGWRVGLFISMKAVRDRYDIIRLECEAGRKEEVSNELELDLVAAG